MNVVLLILIIIGVFAFFALVYYVGKKKEKKFIEEGDIIERKGDYFQQEHIYTTSIDSMGKIMQVVNTSVLEKHEIAYSGNNNVIYFSNSFANKHFKASFKYAGVDQNGKHIYNFEVNEFTEYRNQPYGVLFANVLLTQFEKAIFSLDSTARVERILKKFKIK